MFKKAVFGFLLVSVSLISNAGISRNNYVDWVIASSGDSSNYHMIQWKNELQSPDDCKSNNTSVRTVIKSTDKDLYSLLLAARMANKKVGFYYSTASIDAAVSGHGTPDCKIVNAWIEAE